MPVVEEERLLRDAEEAGDEGEDGEAVLVPGAHVQSLRVKLLHEVLQAGHVHLVLDGLGKKDGKIGFSKQNIIIS